MVCWPSSRADRRTLVLSRWFHCGGCLAPPRHLGTTVGAHRDPPIQQMPPSVEDWVGGFVGPCKGHASGELHDVSACERPPRPTPTPGVRSNSIVQARRTGIYPTRWARSAFSPTPPVPAPPPTPMPPSARPASRPAPSPTRSAFPASGPIPSRVSSSCGPAPSIGLALVGGGRLVAPAHPPSASVRSGRPGTQPPAGRRSKAAARSGSSRSGRPGQPPTSGGGGRGRRVKSGRRASSVRVAPGGAKRPADTTTRPSGRSSRRYRRSFSMIGLVDDARHRQSNVFRLTRPEPRNWAQGGALNVRRNEVASTHATTRLFQMRADALGYSPPGPAVRRRATLSEVRGRAERRPATGGAADHLAAPGQSRRLAHGRGETRRRAPAGSAPQDGLSGRRGAGRESASEAPEGSLI